MTTKLITPATDGQKKQIARLVEEVSEDALKQLGLSKQEAQRLLGRGGEFKRELGDLLIPLLQRYVLAPNIVLVSELSPADLVAQADKKIGLTLIHPNFKTWSFCQYRVDKGQPARFLEVRGKRCEVLTWKPGKYVTTQQVRDHFKDLKADGNTAAFIAWITEMEPAGDHASIPSDDALLCRLSDGRLCAPYFDCHDADRGLGLHSVGLGWDGYWVFVAFREISS